MPGCPDTSQAQPDAWMQADRACARRRMCKAAAPAPEQGAASVQHRHVDGWVQYYEYFHKLNADMQASHRLPACGAAGVRAGPMSDLWLTLRLCAPGCLQ